MSTIRIEVSEVPTSGGVWLLRAYDGSTLLAEVSSTVSLSMALTALAGQLSAIGR